MTDRYSQRISGIAAGRAAEFEQHLNHVLHLLFLGVTVAGHSLLDQARRVIMHRQTLPQERDHRRAPRLAELERGAGVVGNEHVFHRCGLRPVPLDHLGQPVKNNQQSPGEILLTLGADGAAGDKAEAWPQLVNDPVAGDPRAGINADDPQRQGYDSFSISSSGMSKLAWTFCTSS